MKWIAFFFSFFFLALLNGQSVADDIKNYSLGNQWIFGTEQGIGPGISDISFHSNDIVDSYIEGANTVYVTKDGEAFYVEDDKMYFWDHYYEEYIMYYDWNETDSYEIKFYDSPASREGVATVYIDSISYKHFGNDSIKVQYVRVENNGTYEDGDLYEIVYEGIGAGNYEIKLTLGQSLWDPWIFPRELRCFINDTRIYSFVPYDCDSTWTIVGVDDAIQEDLILYPNPTTSQVTIKGLDYDVDYELYNMQGQLVKKDRTKGLSFTIETSGMYIVRFMIDNQWVQRKVLKE